MTAYETDGYAWAMEQADALRRRSANEVDWDRVAEEIEDLAGAWTRELRNRYVILITHLLKWAHQPVFRGRSWSGTIGVQRVAIAQLLEEHPSLRTRDEEQFAKAYAQARIQAEKETGLDRSTFPDTAPFSAELARNDDWFPGEPLP